MTDNVCYSILKTATQQIIQSAGFEAANNHSIDTLADVFGKYIELLGSTVSAYANLNGRTTGNAFDLMEAMNEVAIEPTKLKVWLEEEGKALTPCWSAQSDPGRLIQGAISGGKPNFEDMIEYRFGDDIQEYEMLSPSTSPTIESPSSPLQNTTTLPDYIPSYFPAFPEIKEDEVMEEADKVLFQKQQQLLQQKKEQEEQQQQQQQQQQHQASSEVLPLPLLVKNRKKPIENPFTHIIPFEDSSLAMDNEDGTQQQALSLLVNINNRRKRSEEEEEELINKRRKVATASLMDALVNVKTPEYKLGEGVVGKDDELFRAQTQNAAAPGNYLFNHDIGVFDEVVRNIADPMVIAKLTAPNLHTDIAMINPSIASTPATPTTTTPSLNGGMTFQEMRSSPGPTSPENGLPRSSSMLQALAGGGASSSKKSGLKKFNKLSSSHSSSHIPSTPMSLSALSNQTISKHSVDINNIKTGDSKYIIKKKRMLLEKQQAEERERLEKEFPNMQQSSSKPLPSNNTPITNSTITHTPSSKQNGSTNGPISLSSFSSAAASTSLSSSSSAGTASSTFTPTTKIHSSTTTLEKEKKKKEHKEHKSKGPKLTLNFSSLPQPTLTESVSSPNTPSTPKIRFKVKPPPEQQQHQQQQSNINFSSSNNSSMGMNNTIKLHPSSSPTIQKPPKVPKPNPTTISLQQYQQQHQRSSSSENYTVPIKLEKQHQHMSSPSPHPVLQQQSSFSIVHNNGYSAEEIRCICENPTVDYGTFMIACDSCSVWFHGSCVGIAESDQVEEWYCKRCRGLK